MAAATQAIWTPQPRPDWLRLVNAEGRHMHIESLVPLEPQELLATARRTTGFDDFGVDDGWREGLERYVRSVNTESQLHLFGRLMVRSDVLRLLEARLGIEAAFAAHPEIDEEVISAPVVVSGLGRSGTTILYEILAQDPQFGSPLTWEVMFPYPPPDKATYGTDPRIERCEHLVTQWNRVAPTWTASHQNGALLPQECAFAMQLGFVGEILCAMSPVPSYAAWFLQQDLSPTYAYYKRLLKLLQWRNPRTHWLLKAPSHLDCLPILFKTFPDAHVVVSHRDPIKAQASSTAALGTLYWMRSDLPLDVTAHERYMVPEAMAARLNKVIDEIEVGTIPRAQMHNFLYADLVRDPMASIPKLYAEIGFTLSDTAAKRMKDYLATKPKGKFGTHKHAKVDNEEVMRRRGLLEKYQSYYNVPSED
jgi:hypothetical protein